MTYQPTDIYPGDRIPAPIEDRNLRTVDHVEGSTIFMTDGGVMGVDEVEYILESESTMSTSSIKEHTAQIIAETKQSAVADGMDDLNIINSYSVGVLACRIAHMERRIDLLESEAETRAA